MARYEPLDSQYSLARSCTNLFHCRGCAVVEVEPKALSTTPPNTSSCGVPVVCRKLGLDGLAGWLFHNMTAAFFGSLQRCSCIYVDTKDDPAEDNFIYIPLNNNNNTNHEEDHSAIEIPITTGNM